jgi:hypothetical protein
VIRPLHLGVDFRLNLSMEALNVPYSQSPSLCRRRSYRIVILSVYLPAGPCSQSGLFVHLIGL